MPFFTTALFLHFSFFWFQIIRSCSTCLCSVTCMYSVGFQRLEYLKTTFFFGFKSLEALAHFFIFVTCMYSVGYKRPEYLKTASNRCFCDKLLFSSKEEEHNLKKKATK